MIIIQIRQLMKEYETMRRRNWRIVIAGFLFIVMALGFFLFMMTLAPQSTDPVELLRTAGTVSGTVVGVSVAMIITGLIGKKV
jgi:multidrug resistance efflux pump